MLSKAYMIMVLWFPLASKLMVSVLGSKAVLAHLSRL
jgi:hypothetical protein